MLTFDGKCPETTTTVGYLFGKGVRDQAGMKCGLLRQRRIEEEETEDERVDKGQHIRESGSNDTTMSRNFGNICLLISSGRPNTPALYLFQRNPISFQSTSDRNSLSVIFFSIRKSICLLWAMSFFFYAD